MNRLDFSALCAAFNLDTGVHQRTAYAVIQDDVDFALIQPLLADGCGYLACAEHRAGQAGISYTPQNRIFADDSHDMTFEMEARCWKLLGESCDLVYYSDEHLACRSRALKSNPARAGESRQAHFDRVVAEGKYNYFPPLKINKAGHWCANNNDLVFAEEDRPYGIWAYSYEDRDYCIVFVLKESEKEVV